MYLIINHFAFEYPKEDISDTDIVEVFNNLGKLFIELKRLNVDLITHSTFSQVLLNDKSVRDYILNLEDRNIKNAMMTLMGKVRPICSDTDISYEDKENIAYGNCVEESEGKDICYSFLACALSHFNPILTINKLCSKEQFLKDEIKIICDDDKNYDLTNYQLIPYENVIDKIKGYQKDALVDKYNLIDNWNDYKNFVNDHFTFSKITDHCIEIFDNKYSYSNSYSVDIRSKILRINKLIESEGGDPRSVDFKKISKKHYAPESATRYEDLKKSHSGILNFNNEQVYLDWHTWVQKDCRIYFEKEKDYVSFVHYEKKIT